MSGRLVCVTGASGFIASWLVKLLLDGGYAVRATVRDLGNPEKTKHLLAFEGAKERLQLVKANLLEEGTFDAAVDGCEGVFHTASPFYTSIKDPQGWYQLSKTLAEETAWKFAKEKGIDVVTINPGMVIGTLLQPTLNTSCAAILQIMNGSSTYPNTTFSWVSVKDVAKAHILAFEVPSANGRYLLVDRVAHLSEIVKILSKLYPGCALPTKCADDNPFVPTYTVSKEKIEKLGLNYTPIEEALRDTVESLKEKKLLNLDTNLCADDNPFVPTYTASKEKIEKLGLNYTHIEEALRDTVESLKEKKLLNLDSNL